MPIPAEVCLSEVSGYQLNPIVSLARNYCAIGAHDLLKIIAGFVSENIWAFYMCIKILGYL